MLNSTGSISLVSLKRKYPENVATWSQLRIPISNSQSHSLHVVFLLESDTHVPSRCLLQRLLLHTASQLAMKAVTVGKTVANSHELWSFAVLLLILQRDWQYVQTSDYNPYQPVLGPFIFLIIHVPLYVHCFRFPCWFSSFRWAFLISSTVSLLLISSFHYCSPQSP